MNNEVEWIHLLFRGDQSTRNTYDNHEDQDDDYMIEFRKKGLVAIGVPVLDYKFINIKELSRLLKNSILEDKDGKHSTGLIITSPRVVEAIGKAVQYIQSDHECDKILSVLRQELILVVGDASGKKCEIELGIKYNHDSAKTGSGRALVNYINENFGWKEGYTFQLIYPKSSLTDNTIESCLQSSPKVDIRSIVAYETKPINDLESIMNRELMRLRISHSKRELAYRLIFNLVFFSPSGLESFINVGQDKFVQQLKLIFPGHEIELKYSSIGKTTEAALLRKNLNVHCVSQKPNANSLVESLLLKEV